MNRKLGIDGAEMSVIATTPNGEMKAACWGQTSATLRPLPTREKIAETIYVVLNSKYGDFNVPDDAADAVLALLKGQDA